ncbi:MAG TPA: SMP-30/gluconolactonase/LRE family protein [Chthoniobacteraceae bacterium]|jgi:gluconolactonase
MKRLLPFLLFPVLAIAADEAAYPTMGKITRADPGLDKLIAKDAVIEKLAEGFKWAEGPVWKNGEVLFSDVPQNKIHRWKEGQKTAEVFLTPSGGIESTPEFREPGSNGLAVDAASNLLICQHGARRVARLEADGRQTSLADRVGDKRFNSPNDLVVAKNGDLYFTDPPYGLTGTDKSPLKELPYNGVFRLTKAGVVSVVTKDVDWPNGIALSPDEKRLYVAVSDGAKPRIMAFDVQQDGSVANGGVFFDAEPLKGSGRHGSCDGLKVDQAGNIFATGPGGVLIISPEGKHLGTIETGKATANCGWGDDGSTLYITAQDTLCRVKTLTKGVGF